MGFRVPVKTGKPRYRKPPPEFGTTGIRVQACEIEKRALLVFRDNTWFCSIHVGPLVS